MINRLTTRKEKHMETPDVHEGCPRCRDYDDIKGELDDLKDIREEERESALDECNSNTRRLQKKLTWAGAAALVGTTILGQEFVDSVTSKVEGVKKIVDVADDVISAAPATSTQPPAVPQPEPEKKDDGPKEELKRPFSPYGGDMFEIVRADIFVPDILGDYDTIDLVYGSLDLDLQIMSDAMEPMEPLFSSMGYLPTLSYDLPYERFLDYPEPYMYDTPSVYTSSIVPEPPVLFCVLGALLLRPTRRR